MDTREGNATVLLEKLLIETLPVKMSQNQRPLFYETLHTEKENWQFKQMVNSSFSVT